MSSDIRSEYETRFNSLLQPLAERLQDWLQQQFASLGRIDRISARAKSVDRFVAKAEKIGDDGSTKYKDPLNEIQDQIGGRIVTFYVSDVDRVAEAVKKYLRPIESKSIVPDSVKEFDYVGRHFILFIPTELFSSREESERGPKFFELQIKTLFQHAWSEANHDLGYKPNCELTPHQKRCIAFTSAQAWGADKIFDDLHRETATGESEPEAA